MFDQQPPQSTSRSSRIAGEIGGVVVLLILSVLMALFATVTPEPTPQIHGYHDFTDVVRPSEYTSASAFAHYQWDQ
jgi:hypothetical protein